MAAGRGHNRAMPGPKVLFVDDHEPLRTLLDVYLTRRGYHVTTAGDGAEALQRLGDERPDVVITDVQMPNLDGIELARRLRADPSTSEIPIIMVSTAGRRSTEDCGRPDRFVRKPMRMSDLAEEVDLVLGVRHS
jgi:CheY-like chemotaxis protein